MKFYRMEHRGSRMGMYNVAFGIMRDYSIDERHPSPSGDSKLRAQLLELSGSVNEWHERWRDFIRQHVFGFESIGQMRRWLYSDGLLGRLHEKGIILTIYEAPIIAGHTQAIMHKDWHKNPVKEVSLEDFLKLSIDEQAQI